MKKIVSVVILALMLTGGASLLLAQGAGFVASKGGEKYHDAGCPVAKKIGADKLVKFDNADDALKAGYSPCKTCNPPPSSNALVASKSGGKYHLQGCKAAGSITTDNRLYYKDKADAEKAGYAACQICLKTAASAKNKQ